MSADGVVTMMERWLTENLLEDPNRSYTTFEDDDDFMYVFEIWQFWLIVMSLAVLMAAVVFYFSYKHEVCCGIHKKAIRKEADIEQGKRLATKTFEDSQAFDRLPPHLVDHHMNAQSLRKLETETNSSSSSSGTDASETSSSRLSSGSGSKMHSLISTPRCVLCSKAFGIGENVTHSCASDCHHEFHESCLKQYWAKNPDNNGKCPICKQQYVCSGGLDSA